MKFNAMDSFRDNLPRHRRCYAALRTKRARTRFLGHLTATLGINRKYLIKLLGGKRAYKPHRGRGRSYTPSVRGLLAALWRAAGHPCAEYLKPMLAKLAADYAVFLPANAPRLMEYQRKRDALNSITLYKSIQTQLRKLIREPGPPDTPFRCPRI